MLSDDVKLYTGECSAIMAEYIPDASIDLTVTSPPYDNLRAYNGYTFDFEAIAAQLWRVTKPGGVVVWVVWEMVVDGSETGEAARQQLEFMRLGFKKYHTMFYKKTNFTIPTESRYYNQVEYMFVFSKGAPQTINLIADRKNKLIEAHVAWGRAPHNGGYEKTPHRLRVTNDYGVRGNIWEYHVGLHGSTSDKIAFEHPAIFPEALARDHILSWSNPGDVVLDPMCGSGTTGKMAVLTGRRFIGIDISAEYVELARERIAKVLAQPPLFRLTPGCSGGGLDENDAEQLDLLAAPLNPVS